MKSAVIGQAVPFSADKLNRLAGKLRERRRGAAVVEFAVVAPVFILLVFGMIEFGRMVMVQQILTNASREGARLAVLEGSVVGDVEDSVENYLEVSSINGATVTVDPTPLEGAELGDPVTVTVSVNFSNVSWIPVPMYIGNRVLSASCVMRRESAS